MNNVLEDIFLQSNSLQHIHLVEAVVNFGNNIMPRTLGVDHGERRVGLAVSDELGVMALPLDILPAQSQKQVIRDVLRLCQEKQVAVIVVGLPLNMDGSRGPAVEAVERFVQALRLQTSLPIELWDERMSSRQVERMLIDSDVSRSKRKRLVDKLAAHVVLQSYLDAHAPTTQNSGVPPGDANAPAAL